MSKITYVLNGQEVTKEEFAAGSRQDWLQGDFYVPSTYRDHDPLVSDGLGCMKSQVKQLRETVRQHNIQGVRVKDSGQVEITSRRGRKELLAVRGLVDNDGSYGD